MTTGASGRTVFERRLTRRTLLAGVAGAIAFRADSVAGSIGPGVTGPAPTTRVRPARRLTVPMHRLPTWTVATIGESVQGRPIERLDSRPAEARRHVAVVCGIHGDERASLDLSDAFGRIDRPDDLHLTIVPLANPDGWAARTRRNARNVDLNRNFPWGWPARPDSGPRPASEPETQAVMAFVESTRPDLVVWVHQPLGYVAALRGCPPGYADIWADVASVAVRRNLVQVGGGESWAGLALSIPSMLVEVGGTHAEAIGVDAHASALEALLFAVEAT